MVLALPDVENIGNIPDELRNELERTAFALGLSLSPLAQATKREDVDVLLTHILPLFDRLTLALGQALAKVMTLDEIDALGEGEPDKERDELVDLLGPDVADRLESAKESYEHYWRWLLDASKREQTDTIRDLYVRSDGPAKKARMCMMAIDLIRRNRIHDWRPETLPILIAAADDYMAEVEDVFLAAGTDSQDQDASIPMSEVRRRLAV